MKVTFCCKNIFNAIIDDKMVILYSEDDRKKLPGLYLENFDNIEVTTCPFCGAKIEMSMDDKQPIGDDAKGDSE